MAKRLTEEMVIARTKISDLSKIKRLNCWGSELVDVSLLRRMPAVEVLSLSINKINSLEDFCQCKRLEELYIRQNDIRDLNEVVYLQSLSNLKNLWLGENPCANTDGYRYAVLRALPQLQKLDNVAVTPDELREAQRRGKTLTHPDDPQESEEEYSNHYQYQEQQVPPSQQEYSPQRSPSRQESEIEIEEDEYLPEAEVVKVEVPAEYTPPRQMSPPRRPPVQPEVVRRINYSPEPEYTERRRSSYDPLSPKHQPQQQHEKAPSTNNHEEPITSEHNFKESRLVTSQSTNSIKEYTNGDRYSRSMYREDGSEMSYRHEGPVRSASQHNCSAIHRPPFQRRPVTRNSNILSAVLCLVKELDYPSLEVVEMAVRCRMNELDE
ncbi:dynein axonemal assembly factor 11 isoform X1 [Atheta coriaria]|uniref:dynein axonemal assembly factor 11 isoform X1 n=1 Tax=Dalotia coriaria TaxID=877792 RepID=UPI0031F35F68